jgi:hypothetical protein
MGSILTKTSLDHQSAYYNLTRIECHLITSGFIGIWRGRVTMGCKYWRSAPIFTPHILPTTAITGDATSGCTNLFSPFQVLFR